jgi:FtsP/CotA-like multicopper oxidase with cupredoxin domain
MLEDGNDTPGATPSGVTRREFIGATLAAGAAVALGAALPAATEGSVAQAPAAGTTAGQTLVKIAEIAKNPATAPGPVQGVIKILNEKKTYLGKATAGGTTQQTGQMRYFTGALQGGQDIWPPKNGSPAPGPTIRARVGETVEITLLNQVDVDAFGDSLDVGEKTGGCDVATTVGPAGSVNSYPGKPPFDTMPNCYHGSSTANLHYHGTHVSPNIISDNVFVQLRPSPRKDGQPVVDEKFLAKNDFDDIFTNCRTGHAPHTWGDLPKRWQQRQEELLKGYDKNASWQGKKGLPLEEQLWPRDAADITAGRWPQYFVGAYPSCVQPPVWNKQENSMGQAPGTHWYHAHKHGSTALNLANGLAGAMIIEGDYDDQMKPLYNAGKEVVLVLQQYAAQVNLMRAPGTNVGALVFVNGQYTPVLEMQANEVQFWRIINACHSAAVPINGPTGVKWVQTAQDGVQLDCRNYQLGVQIAQPTPTSPWTNATLTSPMAAPPWFGNLAPGNRVDMLVQAPASGGPFPVTFGTGTRETLLFTIKVNTPGVATPIRFPPLASDFPTMPDFLKDIDAKKVTVKRELHFTTVTGAGRNATTNEPPAHMINGKRFQDHVVDQTMHLGATEEWTLYNDDVDGVAGPAHPFHIHVNPFQVTEILNPAVSKKPFTLPAPWVWWDNIAIPPAHVPPDAAPEDKDKMVSGYVKFRSRFVDFTGAYVLHCHILGHEDRGMMQLVQVITNTTTMGHR